MANSSNWIRRHALPAFLSVIAFTLLALLARTDRDLELWKSLSNRYRFHAIPVSLSHLYHGHPHDYTGRRAFAHTFQQSNEELDAIIPRMIANPPPNDTDTYYWIADDRGLADFVTCSFRLFGPRIKSLTKFYFLFLGVAVALFLAGHWRSPGAMLVPIGVLFGMLALAQVLKLREELPSAGNVWQGEISLNESRLFDMLALVSWAHLAMVAVAPRAGRAAWLTAIPQAALLLFLYHARSSLGWQYLALFALIAARGAWWVRQRWRGERGFAELVRPAFIAALAAGSIAALGQYKKATYHPEYFAGGGPRTFWHNALIGFTFHPGLRTELPMPAVSDQDATRLVLKRMHDANDPRLDATWTLDSIMNSLGSHGSFDWKTYEEVAKETYFAVWRERPAEAAACYAYYKPVAVKDQLGAMLRLLGNGLGTAGMRNLLPGLIAALLGLAVAFFAGRRSAEFRTSVRTAFQVLLAMLPFSLIPGIAFYTAIVTLSCFYVGFFALCGLATVRLAWWCHDRFAREDASEPAPMPVPDRQAA
jgi:hypothetical protein